MQKGIFEHETRLYYNDFDRNGNIRISSILHFLSDIAGMAYESFGYSREWMLERNQVFLLSQFHLEFLRDFQKEAFIRVRTWENGTKGAAFLRYYDIETISGDLLLQASSTWLLADPASHKILRPKEIASETFPVCRGTEIQIPGKLHFDSETLCFAEERRVRYTDIDQNQHVYNAKYADMIYDMLPEQYLSVKPKQFEIQYKKEAVPGETLRLCYQNLPGEITVVGLFSDDEPSFVARITF